jgi:hypothetical protein
MEASIVLSANVTSTSFPEAAGASVTCDCVGASVAAGASVAKDSVGASVAAGWVGACVEAGVALAHAVTKNIMNRMTKIGVIRFIFLFS